MNRIIFTFLVILVLLQSACIKSSVIGGDILKDDEIQIEFSDTSSLIARSLLNDSVRVFSNNSKAFLLGEFHDDNFGEAKSGIFCDFKTAGSIPTQNITNIDSVVFTMVLDTSLIYGDKSTTHTISIFEINEYIKRIENDSFYSNRVFSILPNKLGEIQISPIIDSITVVEPGNDTLVYTEQVRIKLENWNKNLLSDPSQLENDTLFKDIFKGFYIESSTDLSSMISMKKLDSQNKFKTRIDVYYTLNDTLRKSTFFNDNIANQFKHDYSSASIDNYFNNYSIGDSLLFVQGMEGTEIELSIPYLDFLKNKNINKAELELFLIDENKDDVESPSRLVTKYINKDGDLKYIEDYSFLVDNLRQYDKDIYFGYKTKADENGVEVKKYVINLTMHLKALMRDNTFNTKLFISPQNRVLDPGFTVLSGVNRSDLKTKLKITYSNID